MNKISKKLVSLVLIMVSLFSASFFPISATDSNLTLKFHPRYLYALDDHSYKTTSISNNGCVGGMLGQDINTTRGVIWDGLNNATVLEIPEAVKTEVTHVAGNIVATSANCVGTGYYETEIAPGVQQAFFWKDGVRYDISPLLIDGTDGVSAINLDKKVYDLISDKTDDTFSIPRTYSQNGSFPYAVNSKFEVVGDSYGQAFLWTIGGGTQNLHDFLVPLGAVTSSAKEITENSVIFGTYGKSDSTVHGFVMYPTNSGSYIAKDMGSWKNYDWYNIFGANINNHVIGSAYDSVTGEFAQFVWIDGTYINIEEKIGGGGWMFILVTGINSNDDLTISIYNGISYPALITGINTNTPVLTYLDQYFVGFTDFYPWFTAGINDKMQIIGWGLDYADPYDQHIWGWKLEPASSKK